MQFEYPKHYCITMKFVMKSHNNGIINECGNCHWLEYLGS